MKGMSGTHASQMQVLPMQLIPHLRGYEIRDWLPKAEFCSLRTKCKGRFVHSAYSKSSCKRSSKPWNPFIAP